MRSVKKYIQERIVPIPRDEVWSLLSDTNHMNRVIQSFKLDFEGVVSDKKGVYRKAVTQLMGFYKVRWKEYPFEWRKGEYYSVFRDYFNGPVRSFLINIKVYDAEQELPEGGNATRIVLDVSVVSSGLMGDMIIPITVHRQMKRIFTYTLNYLKLRKEGEQHPVPQLKREYEVNLAELDRLFQELQLTEANPSYIPLLRNHLINYDDDMVMNMRPYEWAEKWGCDREDLLRFFLYSTQAGVLNLSWHLICPSCRVSKSNSETLSQVGTSYHCDFCGIDYENNLDRYMELCFSVQPAIRKAYKQVYCIGGPAVTPHIHTQQFARAQQTIHIEIPQGRTPFRLRVLQTKHTVAVRFSPSRSEILPLIYTSEGWSVEHISYNEENRNLTLCNDSNQDVIVVLEEDDWDDTIVTASKVGTMPEFRRMFSSEILAPGHEMGIENITFFFSDLLGSTTFYENVGDAPAYGQVRQHFDFMAKWIQLNRGTIVKKIGDAVMAVFEKPEDGIKAALDIQQHVNEFNATSINASENEPIVIKIGVHHGNAISVNSDDRMDYFGRNVNIAARVQGLSQGNDVVISSSCMARTGVTELLAAKHVSTTQLEATLRGIDHKQTVYRLQLSEHTRSIIKQ
jgi:adenylate cyclase